MPSSRFECDRCGLCCRLIGNVPQLKHFDRGDGACIHLTADNLCDIYDLRPEVCNVARMYSRFASHMTEEEYLYAMSQSCAMLKEHYRELSASLSDSSTRGCIKLDRLCVELGKLKAKFTAGAFDTITGEIVGS